MPRRLSDRKIVTAIKTTSTLECLIGSRPRTFIAHKTLLLQPDQFDYLCSINNPVVDVPFVMSAGHNYVKAYKVNPVLATRNVRLVLKYIRKIYQVGIFEKYELRVNKSTPLTLQIIKENMFERNDAIESYNYHFTTASVLKCMELRYHIRAQDVLNPQRALEYINDYKLLPWEDYCIFQIPLQLFRMLCNVARASDIVGWLYNLFDSYRWSSPTQRKQIDCKLLLLFTLDRTTLIIRNAQKFGCYEMDRIYRLIRSVNMEKMSPTLYRMLLRHSEHWA